MSKSRRQPAEPACKHASVPAPALACGERVGGWRGSRCAARPQRGARLCGQCGCVKAMQHRQRRRHVEGEGGLVGAVRCRSDKANGLGQRHNQGGCCGGITHRIEDELEIRGSGEWRLFGVLELRAGGGGGSDRATTAEAPAQACLTCPQRRGQRKRAGLIGRLTVSVSWPRLA